MLKALADTLDGVLGSLALILDRSGSTLIEIAHITCMSLVDTDATSLTIVPVNIDILSTSRDVLVSGVVEAGVIEVAVDGGGLGQLLGGETTQSIIGTATELEQRCLAGVW